MSLPHIKINGIPIRNPNNMKVDSYNLSKSGRVASGLMNMEIIAKKWKIETTYEVISAAEMDIILGQIDNGTAFFLVEFLYQGTYKTATMYVGDISRTRYRTEMGWYWKDVSFNLIEQ